MASQPFIVGLGGTTRPASTSERALQHAMARLGTLGFDTQVFGSAQMPREPYDPSRPERSAEAAALEIQKLRSLEIERKEINARDDAESPSAVLGSMEV